MTETKKQEIFKFSSKNKVFLLLVIIAYVFVATVIKGEENILHSLFQAGKYLYFFPWIAAFMITRAKKSVEAGNNIFTLLLVAGMIISFPNLMMKKVNVEQKTQETQEIKSTESIKNK